MSFKTKLRLRQAELRITCKLCQWIKDWLELPDLVDVLQLKSQMRQLNYRQTELELENKELHKQLEELLDPQGMQHQPCNINQDRFLDWLRAKRNKGS
jgi:cell division protein FtsB